ncbi:7335_t:CDS:2 [Entrophospora sp. SA101]|nr:7335_t:CDS:2 [Entrophospora sp. SA101]
MRNITGAVNASREEVVQALDTIKRTASQSHDFPLQIIQNTVVNMSQSSYSNMPGREALCKRIARVRNENIPSQPQSLQDIDVPTHLHTTISGEQFSAREIELDEEKIMIFCTTSNLQHLQEANYWIMDGTFKTTPTLSQQIYTIHVLVGGENNACDFPMVYTLMTSKSEESYRCLFQELVNLGEETGHHLALPMILTDFEQAAINAAQSEFPGSINKGCFFHLCQNIWRKIQTLGLAIEYSNDEDFNAFDQIRPLLPESAAELAQYFENNYVHGRIWHELRNGNVVCSPPLFPPGLWSVHELVRHSHPQTQNTVEAWHH